jgi:hypothetical protein
MADHRPWLKLWTKALADPDLGHLSMADRGRWVWLLLHVSLHGEQGRLVLKRGIGELRDLFTDWVGDDETPSQADPLLTHPEPTLSPARTRVRPRAVGVLRLLKRLPGVSLQEASFPESQMTVMFTKWSKYQVDSSMERTRTWRQRQRTSDGKSPSHGDGNTPSQAQPRDGARREETRREPPNPRDPDINPAHIRFNIPDR